MYGGNNKFGNPDSHTGSLTISHFLLGFTLLKMGDAVCKLSGLIALCGHIHTGRTFFPLGFTLNLKSSITGINLYNCVHTQRFTLPLLQVFSPLFD